MHFAPSFATLTLFLSTCSFVSSLSIFRNLPNDDASLRNSIEERGNPVNVTETNLSCMNPSQINLNANDPGLGSCNWKKWAECTALAVGACLLACEAGGSVSSHLPPLYTTQTSSKLTKHSSQLIGPSLRSLLKRLGSPGL